MGCCRPGKEGKSNIGIDGETFVSSIQETLDNVQVCAGLETFPSCVHSDHQEAHLC